MTNTMKTKATKITSLLLALVMMLSVFGGVNLTAFAQSFDCNIKFGTKYQEVVENVSDEHRYRIYNDRTYDSVMVKMVVHSSKSIRIDFDLGADVQYTNGKDFVHYYIMSPNSAATFAVSSDFMTNGWETNFSYDITFYDATPLTEITSTSANSNKIELTCKSVSGVDGYQIAIATKSDFSNQKVFNGAGNVGTLSNLSANCVYYVRACCYDGNNYFPWSKPVKVKTTGKTITPKATTITKLTKGTKSFKVNWKKVSGITGYQLQYSTKKNMKGAKIKTVKNAKASKATVKKLKKNKKYYVRVRTFKVVNGKKVYSKWSAKKVVKTK